MSGRLSFGDSIWRFRDNDERFDVFVNGTDADTYLTDLGDTVPSLRKFMADTMIDVSDLLDRVVSFLSYSITIESSNGTAFRYGEASATALNARVFSNGTEVTADLAASRFKWRRVSAVARPYPDDDATWNSVFVSGYKSVSIAVDDVYSRATFFCEILE